MKEKKKKKKKKCEKESDDMGRFTLWEI